MSAWQSFLSLVLSIASDIFVLVTVPWYNGNLERSALAFIVMPCIVAGCLTSLFYYDNKRDHAKTSFLSAFGISEVYYYEQGATTRRGVKA